MQPKTFEIEASGHVFVVEMDEEGKFIMPPMVRELLTMGTALKPSWEPICLARKPLIGTVAANVLEHGSGALNIDGCRVGTEENLNGGAYCDGNKRAEDASSYVTGTKAGEFVQPAGRWPANIIHDGSDEVLAGFPDSKSSDGIRPRGTNNNVFGAHKDTPFESYGDSGSAARFFYTAKADKLDRIGSKHPTVKPVDLMQWLCRMVTPPGGVVLDPFAGSGSTGEAAWREGFRCILIEREEEYQADIAARLRLADKGPATRKARAIKQAANDDLPLFGGAKTGGGYGVKSSSMADTNPSSSSASTRKGDGGIMAGKGGFGFRIKERANG